MNHAQTLDSGVTKRSLRRELDLVVSAIRMVAGGGAPGVTLVGLDFGPAVLDGSAQAALNAGVVLEPLWQPDLARCDIRVSPGPTMTERPDLGARNPSTL